MISQPILELNQINKSFGHVQANKDISLKFSKGDIHGIIGENGAGKSTLVKILFGLYQADEGEILLQKQIEILPDDTLGTLYFDKIFPAGVVKD